VPGGGGKIEKKTSKFGTELRAGRGKIAGGGSYRENWKRQSKKKKRGMKVTDGAAQRNGNAKKVSKHVEGGQKKMFKRNFMRRNVQKK